MPIAHVALWTRDLDAAAAFWRDVFHADVGAPYCSQRRAGFISRFVTMPDGGPRIELMEIPGLKDAPPANHVGWDHIAISVGSPETVDQLTTRCQEHGLLLSPPRTTGDGFYEAVISMPDGTPVEITS